MALPRRGGRLRAGLAADHGGQPAARRHGPRLLPPVRDRLQPRRARRVGRDQLRRALPRRRGDQAGLARRGHRAALRQARARRRRRALRPVGRLPPRPRRTRGHDPRRRPAARRHDALRHPALPPAARDPRRGDPAHPRPRRRARAQHEGRPTCSRRSAGGFDAVFLAVGAHLGKRAYIPAGSAAKVLDAVSVLRSMEGEDKPLLGRRVAVYGGGNTAMDVARTASGSAPRRRSSSTGARATACPPTTSRSRRRSRRACS